MRCIDTLQTINVFHKVAS